jgi:hypothetical protein
MLFYDIPYIFLVILAIITYTLRYYKLVYHKYNNLK